MDCHKYNACPRGQRSPKGTEIVCLRTIILGYGLSQGRTFLLSKTSYLLCMKFLIKERQGIYMRVTNRQGKGTAKHNFREFDLSKADHIDDELLECNKYMLGNKSISLNQIIGFHFKIKKELSQIKGTLRSLENQHQFDTLTRTEQIELCVYNRVFGDMVKEQNERHISTGHYSKQRDILCSEL